MAAYTFPRINGQQLQAPEEEAALQTLALAADAIGAQEFSGPPNPASRALDPS